MKKRNLFSEIAEGFAGLSTRGDGGENLSAREVEIDPDLDMASEEALALQENIRRKAAEFSDQLDKVVEAFHHQNPTIPAQALMAGIGMLAIQFSLSHVGVAATLRFISELEEATKRHAVR